MNAVRSLAFALIIGTKSLNAQKLNNGKPLSKTQDGIYRTYKEFEYYHFYDSIDTSKNKARMKNNDFDQVVLKEGKHKRKYTEGEIYGYSLNGKEYRYFDSKEPLGPYGYFEIIDDNGLVLYRQTENSNADTVRYDYFYSKDFTSPVKALAKHNLKEELKNKEYINSVFALEHLNEFKNGQYTILKIYNEYKTKPSNL